MLSQRTSKIFATSLEQEGRLPGVGGIVSWVQGMGQGNDSIQTSMNSRRVWAQGGYRPAFTQWQKSTESLKHRGKSTLSVNGVRLEGPEGSYKSCLQTLGQERDQLGLLQL